MRELKEENATLKKQLKEMQEKLDGRTFREQPKDSNHEHCKNEINKLRLLISKVQECGETSPAAPPHCDQVQNKPMDSASSENAQFDIDAFVRGFDTYNL